MLRKNTVKLLQEGKHFCVLPWVHFHSWPNGNVMPCCVADSENPVSKIDADTSILEMMNSRKFRELRRNMLEDKPSDICKRCYDLEMLGTWTMRQSHNTRRGKEYIPIIDATSIDGSIKKFQMKYMDIRFSNLCNMKCRTCGPGCSSQWAEEFVKEKGGVPELEKHFGIKKIVVNSNEDQIFMTKLKPYLKDVLEVYFAGGEVIITQEHYECLQYWIDNGLTDQVELTYTTNFSALKYKNKNLINMWKKFSKVKIWASLDDGGSRAELIRKGTDWDRIVKNIQQLKEQAPHVEFEITPTISIYNIFSFADFFDEMVDKGLISLKNPRFNMLSWPWYANIMILPDHVKKKLMDRYRASAKRYADNETLKNGFRLIVYTLKQGQERKDGILEFKKYNDEVDSHRKENHLEVIPELKEVYEWAES
mgnify:FL=1